jgi:hypothetical protein
MRQSFQSEPDPTDPALLFLANVLLGISLVFCGCLLFAWVVMGILAFLLFPLRLFL